MTKQEQINMLQFRIERIESHLAEQHKGNNFNLSEIPNSCEPDDYIPQPGEVVEVATARKVFVTRIFTRYDPSSDSPFMTIVNDLTDTACNNYRKGLYYGETDWRFCRRLSGEIIEFGCDKPTQYHVAVHEAVTAEPNPYAVDWSNAPEWADVHCYDDKSNGVWFGAILYKGRFHQTAELSGFTLPTGLDWKQSKTTRP